MKKAVRNSLSFILLLLAIPLVAAGGLEISGIQTNLLQAIAFSLAAQAAILSGGFIASPKEGKVGLPRAIAFTFYIFQAFALPVFVTALAYKKFKEVVPPLVET